MPDKNLASQGLDSSNDNGYTHTNIEREIEYMKQEPIFKQWKSPTGEVLDIALLPTVYPPREDTYMISETLVSIGKGNGNFLEIGSGSGVVSICAARMGWNCYACDTNPFAVASSIENANLSNASLKVAEGGPGPSPEQSKNTWWFNKQHDLILWNLPYLRIDELPREKLGPLEESALLDNDDLGVAIRALQKIKQHNILTRRGLVIFLLKFEDSFNIITEANMLGFAARVDRISDLSDGDRMCIVKIWNPWIDSNRLNFETITSTNDYALENLDKLGSLVTSDKQTAGKGRRKNKWSSSVNSIAATWLIADQRTSIDPIASQLIAGFVISNIVKRHTNEDIILKWPNDVYKFDGSRNGKIAGVLVEGKSMGNSSKVVCGIGINLHCDDIDYPFPIASLGLKGDEITSKETLISQLNAGISSYFESRTNVNNCKTELILSRISETIKQGASIVGKYTYKGSPCVVDGIDHQGRLLVIVEENVVKVEDSDEIAWEF